MTSSTLSVTNSSKSTKISDYQLIEQLGLGGCGAVWLGKSKSTSQIYAVKVIEKEHLWKSAARMTLLKEAKIMKNLKGKPRLLQLHESFHNPKYAFMVLDLAVYGDLYYWLDQVGSMKYEEVSYYLVQISAALNSLHESKIIYRDLKPDNVLLDDKGHVKLADFGLSKDVSETYERTSSFCGTFTYLAPEVHSQFAAYNYAIDWYSLGIMTHELLTGDVPFPKNVQQSRPDLVKAIVQGNLSLDPRLKPKARSFIVWLTSLHPNDRPENMDELKTHPWIAKAPWDEILSEKQKY
ncbi:hypothetical protein CROQUDRAFT_673346 [Cronartium quercuum f. sp. fusiforme G11]|uniref:Protein kinase domain-containing protein n=1 Tax=Cronartium quercuum f. sp. fusiforme G11 TaxID=708437 RepID=A0A9P6NAU4_9BASI|nr:hypothetical protein CROQUDRAFT_673346 [Cronartium quercuum f. sp. fusiforme G11]